VANEVSLIFQIVKAVKIYVVFCIISISGPSTLKMEATFFSETLVNIFQKKKVAFPKTKFYSPFIFRRFIIFEVCNVSACKTGSHLVASCKVSIFPQVFVLTLGQFYRIP